METLCLSVNIQMLIGRSLSSSLGAVPVLDALPVAIAVPLPVSISVSVSVSLGGGTVGNVLVTVGTGAIVDDGSSVDSMSVGRSVEAGSVGSSVGRSSVGKSSVGIPLGSPVGT